MKELSKQDKDAIRDALLEYCGNYPSQNRASESLNGVSAATVSQICNQKYTSISDDMFSRIAAQIGFSMDRWTLTESNAFQRITFAMSDAQAYKNTTWVVGDAGCGKTTAAIEYRRTHRNVFYILCSEDMKKSDFVREIAKQVGAPVDGTNLRDILEYAISMIAFLQNPLIIFDEGDKLTDSVFSYFISIYNRLENKAGIIFLSTDYIKRRVENGLRYAASYIRMELTGEEEGGYLLTVENDGAPIPQPTLNVLFQKFYKGADGNFGLGLYIAKKIVQFHKGDIWASNWADGVRFQLLLRREDRMAGRR